MGAHLDVVLGHVGVDLELYLNEIAFFFLVLKTTCTNFRDLQQLFNKSVHNFSLRLQETFTKLCAAAMADVRLAVTADQDH